MQRPTIQEPGIVRITIDGKGSNYAFDILRGDVEQGGCCLELRKSESQPPYHVEIARDGSSRCDCFGSLRWGHCKHTAIAAPLLCKLSEMGQFA